MTSVERQETTWKTSQDHPFGWNMSENTALMQLECKALSSVDVSAQRDGPNAEHGLACLFPEILGLETDTANVGIRVSLGCAEQNTVLRRKLRVGTSIWEGPQIREVFIPNTVRVLSGECFNGCYSLCRVVFCSPSSLERIGVSCFTGTHIREVNIPDSVRELCDNCFYGCTSLSRVVFGCSSSLERIGVSAFSGRSRYACSIEEITIPDSVRELCDECFKGCKKLRRVTFGSSSALERVGRQAFARTSLRGHHC